MKFRDCGADVGWEPTEAGHGELRGGRWKLGGVVRWVGLRHQLEEYRCQSVPRT
jgi:hypothetical protein